MSPTEAIPLLIVVLLMISIGGADVEQMTVNFQGEQTAETGQAVQVVAGGTTTVPNGSTVSGDIYVIGGTVSIEGTVDGDVTVLAGNLSIQEGAIVSGTVQQYGGETTIDDGATVGKLSEFPTPVPGSSPAQRVWTFVGQFAVLGAGGLWLGRRHPLLLENVGHSITGHPLVSGVTGSLAAVTLLVLFVNMALTIILIPLSIVGLIGEFLVVLYGQIAFGHEIGRRLPVGSADGATVAGIGLFLLLVELLGVIPYLGALTQLGLLAVGFGAVLNTYFGLQRFEPVAIPGERES